MNLSELIRYYGLKHGVKIDFMREVIVENISGRESISIWRSALPQPSAAELAVLAESYHVEMAKLDYRNRRADAYPAIEEQLDMLYHDKVNGTNLWFDTITAIKNKYPKA